MSRGMVFTLAFALIGCSQAVPEESTSAAIQGGTPDTVDNATVLLFRPPGTQGASDGGDWCTGTLITPTIVLTAAHCIQAGMTRVYTGVGVPESWSSGATVPYPDASMTEYNIVESKPNPQWIAGACPVGTNYVNVDTGDIGLVRVSSNTHITPFPYATSTQDAPIIGALAYVVGYGRHGQDGVDLTIEARRGGNLEVIDVGAQIVRAQMTVAVGDSGDSGGPLFWDGKLAATTICHTDGDWIDNSSGGHKIEYYQRVDTMDGFISSTTTQLNADCEAECGTGTCNTCLCLAQRYSCERSHCGENRPIISCFRPGL